jgi:hypothetical protein
MRFDGLTARIADSNSKNAVSLSSARTMKRFPLPRCASAMEIVRPLESTAESLALMNGEGSAGD